MSKIQEFFSAGGRRLFDSEKPVVDAFNDKYSRVLTAAVVPQRRAERADPQSGQNRPPLEARVLASGKRFSEQTRVLAASVLTQKQSGAHVQRLAATVLGSDKEHRGSPSVSAQARNIKRQKNITVLASKKLTAGRSK
jgi:hypothetical protein